jgi:hypothetical protein
MTSTAVPLGMRCPHQREKWTAAARASAMRAGASVRQPFRILGIPVLHAGAATSGALPLPPVRPAHAPRPLRSLR